MVQLSSYDVPVVGIHHTEEDVQATVEGTSIGSGTLYITESNVVWLNDNQEGMQLEYKIISLHAISSPKEYLLLHYDAKLPHMNSESGTESDDDGIIREPEMSLTQIKLSPENKESLDAMFSALADCQCLHPDSDCQLSEDEFEDANVPNMGDGFFQDESGFAMLNAEGRANLERMNSMLQAGQGDGDADLAARTVQQLNLVNGHVNGHVQDDQFQDADDMDDE